MDDVKSAEQTQALAVVEERANQFRNKAKTLEAQVRAQLKAELQEVQTAVDIAAATAYRAGASKAAVGRALGSQDYNTYNDSIERGLSVVGNGSTNSGLIMETYWHGNEQWVDVIRGSEAATFKVGFTDDESESPWLIAITDLWSDEYTVKNQLVAELDMETGGDLFNEVMKYVMQNS